MITSKDTAYVSAAPDTVQLPAEFRFLASGEIEVPFSTNKATLMKPGKPHNGEIDALLEKANATVNVATNRNTPCAATPVPSGISLSVQSEATIQY